MLVTKIIFQLKVKKWDSVYIFSCFTYNGRQALKTLFRLVLFIVLKLRYGNGIILCGLSKLLVQCLTQKAGVSDRSILLLCTFMFLFGAFLEEKQESVYFKVLTPSPHSRIAAWPQIQLWCTYPCGSVATWPQQQGLQLGGHQGKQIQKKFAATQPRRENFKIDTPKKQLPILQYIFLLIK